MSGYYDVTVSSPRETIVEQELSERLVSIILILGVADVNCSIWSQICVEFITAIFV